MELNQIRDKLDKKEYEFLSIFEDQLELTLYFIGSITRSDFIKGKSDLDIEVFTENMTSTKYKVNHLLNYYYKKKEPKYMVFKINGTPISGYKYCFKNKDIFFDFTIYKKESQELLLHQRIIEINIPVTLSIFLFIIKYLYYYLHVINNDQYSFIKKKLWFLYNPEKTVSESYTDQEYARYLDSENGDKKFLI